MLTPQENPYLTGHDTLLESLKKAVVEERLPHALIFNGAPGIGKTTCAFHLIRYALGGEGEANNTVAKKIAAHSHPSVLLVTPSFDEKKQRYKSILTVDEAHKVVPFFRQTSVDNTWRFVVVDKAHTMNRNAQNAVLKILEEPPERSTIILISENSGAFLPTIRSRCQLVQLNPLTEEEVIDELEDRCPELSQEQIDTYAHLSQGSLGRAFELIEMDALTVAEDFEQASLDMVQNKENTALQFCEDYGHNSKDQEYGFIKDLMSQDITTVIHAKIAEDDTALSPWQSHLYTHKQEKDLIDIHDKVEAVFQAGDTSFLDRKLVLLNALQAMR